MRTHVFLILSVLGVVQVACEKPVNHGAIVEVVSILPQRPPRVVVTLKYEDGSVIADSTADDIKCGSETLVMNDFISGKRAFGELKLNCRNEKVKD